MGEDSMLVSYMCKTCKTLFFSAEEVTYHKAMTGHGVYEQREIVRANSSAGPENIMNDKGHT
jgi:hypothetical protein